MQAKVLAAVNNYFLNRWTSSDIQYGDQPFSPTTQRFIKLDVLPLLSTNQDYSKRTLSTIGIYGTSFESNQLTSTQLMDELTTFIKAMDIPGIEYDSYAHLSQITVVQQHQSFGGYAIKNAFQIKIYCDHMPEPPMYYDCSTPMSCYDYIPCELFAEPVTVYDCSTPMDCSIDKPCI